MVHVAGAVVAPGSTSCRPGAGWPMPSRPPAGSRRRPTPARINLAAPVADGERVYVARGRRAGAAGRRGQRHRRATAGAPTGPVNLNTADAEALDALPGIGPATAAAIIEHRGKVGAFTSVDQLLDVPGIGDAKLEALRDLVTV